MCEFKSMFESCCGVNGSQPRELWGKVCVYLELVHLCINLAAKSRLWHHYNHSHSLGAATGFMNPAYRYLPPTCRRKHHALRQTATLVASALASIRAVTRRYRQPRRRNYRRGRRTVAGVTTVKIKSREPRWAQSTTDGHDSRRERPWSDSVTRRQAFSWRIKSIEANCSAAVGSCLGSRDWQPSITDISTNWTTHQTQSAKHNRKKLLRSLCIRTSFNRAPVPDMNCIWLEVQVKSSQSLIRMSIAHVYKSKNRHRIKKWIKQW